MAAAGTLQCLGLSDQAAPWAPRHSRGRGTCQARPTRAPGCVGVAHFTPASSRLSCQLGSDPVAHWPLACGSAGPGTPAATGPDRWAPPRCQRWPRRVVGLEPLVFSSSHPNWLRTMAGAPGLSDPPGAGGLQMLSSPGGGAGPWRQEEQDESTRRCCPPVVQLGPPSPTAAHRPPEALQAGFRTLPLCPLPRPSHMHPRAGNDGGRVKRADLSSYALQLLEGRADSAVGSGHTCPPAHGGSGPGPGGPAVADGCGSFLSTVGSTFLGSLYLAARATPSPRECVGDTAGPTWGAPGG